ncbi:MAG: hypothetical protein QNK31_05690 [Porticoccus sp.]|nr:hypothetical protein [Porticoccus sp.]
MRSTNMLMKVLGLQIGREDIHQYAVIRAAISRVAEAFKSGGVASGAFLRVFSSPSYVVVFSDDFIFAPVIQ